MGIYLPYQFQFFPASIADRAIQDTRGLPSRGPGSVCAQTPFEPTMEGVTAELYTPGGAGDGLASVGSYIVVYAFHGMSSIETL